MVLYDKEGREKFYSPEEVKDFFIDYVEFDVRRISFDETPEIHVKVLLEEMESIRRIPKSLRLSLPDYFKIRDSDLNELEEKCKKYN